MTVPGTAARHPGHHRAIYSKTVAGDLSFFDGLWVAFGTLGRPKASATLFGQPFWSHFKPKSRKRGIQKGIPKNVPKKLRKIYQKASKIIPEWKEKSTIGHAPWKTTKVEKLLFFPIEDVVRAMQKRVKTN